MGIKKPFERAGRKENSASRSGDELYRILNCPYYDKVYGCLDCYIEKCPYYEVETEEIQ